MINENNDLVISYVVHGQEKNAALLAFEESKNTEKKGYKQVCLSSHCSWSKIETKAMAE